MIIHVIRPNETVKSIANTYGISVDWLIKENGIRDPDNLVVGGTLIILHPNKTHTVVDGDSLNNIAKTYNVTVMDLLRNNSYLCNQEYLNIGDLIVIDYKDTRKRNISVSGYCFPFIQDDILRKTLPYLTYLFIYSYLIEEDGQIQHLDDSTCIEYSRTYGVAPIMIVSFSKESGVSGADIAHNILNNETLKSSIMEDIVSTLDSKDYSGINISPFYIYPSDRQLYVNFMEELVDRINALGLHVFDTIIPNTFELITDLFNTQSYIQISNQLVDKTVVFPLSVGITLNTPIGESNYYTVKSMIEYFLKHISPETFLLGINTVGYIWDLPYRPGISDGNSISSTSARALARDYNIPILFDAGNRVAYFTFQEKNKEFLVRYRDARSFDTYLELVNKYNLDGIGVWNIMSFSYPLWHMVNAQYYINKVDI